MANNNYPTVLFNGSSLMQHAHSITQKVQNELSRATYEYLSAQPVDALIQKLYTDNQIHLPCLRRDQIHHTHFEGYIAPYVEPPSQYSRLGQRKYQDVSRGIIWAFHVGFVGDKRYFSLKPSKVDPNHPLALLGEDKLTVYIPQRNNAMPQIEASFENTLALIDIYLKLQHETLLNYPMTFYRTIETVINGRLHSLKATRDIAATLRYPSAEQLPPPRAPTPQPQKPAPAPRSAEEPKPMVDNHLLLTGAGFSKNWGGLLASEVFNDLLSASELDDTTRDMLYRANEPHGGGFENVLGRLQTATDAANILRREALTSVLVGIFNAMGAGYMQRQFEFSPMPDTRYSLTPFLGRFQAIYTTNQDTLIEQKYLPVSSHQRRAHLPGLKYINPSALTGSAHDAIAVMEPNPPEFKLSTTMQPYIKLHGSVNWVESNVGERILIMGGQKTAIIKRFPLLNWYHEEFRKALALPGARLMVMGYSFSDEHINDAILAAVKTSDLKIFIVDPGGVGIIDKRDKSAAIPIPKEEFQELLEKRIIGISTRPISSTFNDDIVENNRLQKFFQS